MVRLSWPPLTSQVPAHIGCWLPERSRYASGNARARPGAPALALRPGGQALLAHQASDGVLAGPPAVVFEVDGDPRRPVLALMEPEQVRDLGLSRCRRAARGGNSPPRPTCRTRPG